MTHRYDVFICHASEDKDTIALPLRDEMEARGISVWIDKDRGAWGDEIVGAVGDGLRNAGLLVAIVTRSLVAKKWPVRELNSAISMELEDGESRVLPIFAGPEDEIARLRRELPLIHGKLFRIWKGDPESIVDELELLLASRAEGSQEAERSAITTAFWAGNYSEAAARSQTRLELATAENDLEPAAIAFANLLLIARGRRRFASLVQTMQRYFPQLQVNRLPADYRLRVMKELFVYYYEREDFTRSALYLERMERIDPSLMAYPPADDWLPGTIRWRKAHLLWLMEPTKSTLKQSIGLGQEGFDYLDDVARYNPNTAGLASAALNLGWLYYLVGNDICLDYFDVAIEKAAAFSPRTKAEAEAARVLALARFSLIPQREALRLARDIDSSPGGPGQSLRSYAFLRREPDWKFIDEWQRAISSNP